MSNQPSQAAIDLAIKNGNAMFGEYLFFASKVKPGMYLVTFKADWNRSYTVDTREGKNNCSCPQFEKEGVCKHQYFVQENLRVDAECEAAETAESYAGKF